MIPYSNARWLAAKIPNAELKFISGEGYISLGVKYRYDIVTQLRAFLGVKRGCAGEKA